MTRGKSQLRRDRVGGSWIGIDLFFQADRVTKIKVGLSVDMDEEVKKVNVTREFKGLIFQFFDHYSDALRDKTLGPAEVKRDPNHTP